MHTLTGFFFEPLRILKGAQDSHYFTMDHTIRKTWFLPQVLQSVGGMHTHTLVHAVYSKCLNKWSVQ